jgi:uncharacterized protein GlcG (DUF336 family)
MASPAAAADITAFTAMAERARATCAARGFPTTVSIVGMDGQPIVVLRSDNAPIHTVQNSFDKAYTVMTLGPLKRVETTSELAAAYRQQPGISYALAAQPLPHITFSAGAVLVRLHGQVVGGLGVSGSDGGDIDEACARAGSSGPS